MHGFYDGYRIFANTNTPITQPSASGVGWGSASDDAWCLEFQVKLLNLSPDADRDITFPDFLTSVRLFGTGKFEFKWEDRDSVVVEIAGT